LAMVGTPYQRVCPASFFTLKDENFETKITFEIGFTKANRLLTILQAWNLSLSL
jgi:hypothetical protein